MSNNADVSRFLMLTLGITAAFMHFFGVALLKWQMGHSFLYAYTMALSDTSLTGAEGLNTVFYTVACLAVGAFGAWFFGVLLQAGENALYFFQVSRCQKHHAKGANTRLDVVCGRGGKS